MRLWPSDIFRRNYKFENFMILVCRKLSTTVSLDQFVAAAIA